LKVGELAQASAINYLTLKIGDHDMSRSARFVLRDVMGRRRQNFNMPGVITSGQAVVHITAGEVALGGEPSVVGPDGTQVVQTFLYNLGDADIWVSNISPHFNQHFPGEPGGVEFILHVNWDSPLDVGITITVEDQTPFDIQN
jgi:hypothetical protein